LFTIHQHQCIHTPDYLVLPSFTVDMAFTGKDKVTIKLLRQKEHHGAKCSKTYNTW